MFYYHEALFMPRVVAAMTAKDLGNGYVFGNDLYQVWLSTRELQKHRNPYSPEITREIQIGLYGRTLDPRRATDPVDPRAFPYPVYMDLLFWPTAEFSFRGMRVVLLCMLICLTVATVLLWLRALDWHLDPRWIIVIVLLTLSSYSVLEGLFATQLGLVVAFFLAAAVLALIRKRHLLAGMLMGLTTIKPQVTALVILYLVVWSVSDWRTRRGFCLGLFPTLGLLIGIPFLFLPHWIQSWIHAALAYHHYTPPPLVTQVLTSPLGTPWSGRTTLALSAVALLVAAVLTWRNRSATAGSERFWITLNILLAITTIVYLPGQAVYDHVILLPGILWLVQHRADFESRAGILRILLSIGAFVLFWPWFVAAFVDLGSHLSPVLFSKETLFLLPLRNATPLPFVVLIILAWMWRTLATAQSTAA